MIKVHEIDRREGYNIITFTDGPKAYGALIILDKENMYLEFMEFEGEELVSITEEETPKKFKRLEEKYIEELLSALE